MSSHEIYVAFRFWGFNEHPDEVSSQLRITPSRIFIKDKPISPGNKRLAKSNVWVLNSSLENKVSVEEQLNALIATLEPRKEQLKVYCDKYESEFSFTFYIDVDTEETRPAIFLTKEQIRFISYLNSECDFDVILVSDIEPKDKDW